MIKQTPSLRHLCKIIAPKKCNQSHFFYYSIHVLMLYLNKYVYAFIYILT